ncbi:hypothetical protein LEP1GSC047_1773 [Leptospira inadai serovar Lyme str. 10]|uniref:DUF3147 family protein n=2 Tax=Leptospira inadai serovar Lyme TaxID=293084 RepID=V6HQK9_9LEPT|nr:DUF3147 family protein [Leptospira inadai]EQA34714.1 hypothetical protein LEP1GSC047_1773 [Leptospira inadai serovar Lyme str. 10]PNV76192.1 hypothetical protein BES34_004075 [Leptospira inadai serovar Lyme]
MSYLLFKYFLTSLLVVLISEAARRNERLGGLLAALPIITILTLIWLKIDKVSSEKISNHAYYTFWYVLPTLPMFLIFPKLNQKFDFWPALIICITGTILLFFLFGYLTGKFGIKLL